MEGDSIPSPLEDHLIDSYRPFIADVPRSSWSQPFPVPEGEARTEEDIQRTKDRLRRKISSKNFDPPIPLSDFCLIAEERWNREEQEGVCPPAPCLLW
jgi:hypothetical protein